FRGFPQVEEALTRGAYRPPLPMTVGRRGATRAISSVAAPAAPASVYTEIEVPTLGRYHRLRRRRGRGDPARPSRLRRRGGRRARAHGGLYRLRGRAWGEASRPLSHERGDQGALRGVEEEVIRPLRAGDRDDALRRDKRPTERCLHRYGPLRAS